MKPMILAGAFACALAASTPSLASSPLGPNESAPETPMIRLAQATMNHGAHAPAAATVGAVSVSGPFAFANPAGAGAGAAFMTIAVEGGDDVLVSASSPVASRVELHTHVMDGGVMRMRQVPNIAVPGELKPGGDHVMLMGLRQALEPGQEIDLTLTFEKAGDMTLKVPVLERAAGGMGGGEHKHH